MSDDVTNRRVWSNAEKQRAYRIVQAAHRAGTITRPSNCTRCGELDRKVLTGVHSIQGHHHRGYDRALDLEWLCPKCHASETAIDGRLGASVFGERNGAARLTQSQVDEIRNSPNGCRILGRRYGVDKKTIQRIRNGLRWPEDRREDHAN